MKSTLEQSTREELIARTSCLSENSKPYWGQMDVHRMLEHCIRWDEMVLQNKTLPRPLIGRILGKILLKNELQDKPMRKNSPTSQALTVQDVDDRHDMEECKTKRILLIREYAHYTLPDFTFVHPFFGKLTREQTGLLAYKHADHHLRQFGC